MYPKRFPSANHTSAKYNPTSKLQIKLRLVNSLGLHALITFLGAVVRDVEYTNHCMSKVNNIRDCLEVVRQKTYTATTKTTTTHREDRVKDSKPKYKPQQTKDTPENSVEKVENGEL